MPEPSSPITELRAAPGASPSPALFPTSRQLFLLLAAYFILQVILRVAFSSSVDLDESEQVVVGQQLSLGYGSDPPLYTWLQHPLFWAFGESVLALSLFKNLLLLALYGLTFTAARIVTRSTTAAVAAALSVLFLPEVAWESQRDLTHTILSAVLSLVSFYCLLQVFENRRTRWYLLFGVSFGLGLLSKFNYVFWPLGLLLAATSIPQLRSSVFDRRTLLGLLLGVAVFLPNALWMLAHPDLALLTSSKFDVRQHPSWLADVGLGFKHLVESIVGFGAPLALIFTLVFCKAPVRTPEPAEPSRIYRTLIVRAWIIIGILLLALVVFARATGFKERWFEPILMALPVAAVAFVQRRLDALRLKIITTLSLVVMLAVAIIMPGRLLAAERLKREEPLTRPYAQLATQISASIPEDSLVVCDTRLLAGNLRLGLRQARCLPTELVPLLGGNRTHCFLAWDARANAAVPVSLTAWVSQAGKQVPAVAPQFFSTKYRYHHTKEFRLGLLQLY